MATYGNRNYLPTARGGLVDQNPVWSAPTPAGSAPTRTVQSAPFKVPTPITKIPATMWAPSTGTAQNPQAASAFMGNRLAPDPYYYADNESRYLPSTSAQPTKVASATPPIPLSRPSAFSTYMDDPKVAAAYLERYGMPAPPAVAAELSTVPPVAAAAPPSGGQLAALLEAAKGLGGLLSGVTGNPGGPAKPAPTAADYNTQRKAGMSDWTTSSGGATYSPTLMDKQTSYNKPGAKKVGRGNSKHTGAGK